MTVKYKSPPSDKEARSRIRSSLDESLMVEAAAGTGKTSELISRLVAILQTGKTTIDRIVAVTFTRKAAGELRLRIRMTLDRKRTETLNVQETRNLEKAIARLEEARIGTIHSFCADLLRERPVEAQVDPSFEELSEEEASRLFEQAFRGWIEKNLAELPPGLRRSFNRSVVRQGSADLSPLEQIKRVGWKLLEWRDFPRSWRREPFDRSVEIDNLLHPIQELSEMSWECRNWRDDLRKGLRPIRDFSTWIRRAEREKTRNNDQVEGFLVQLLKDLRNPRNRKKGMGFFADQWSREVVIQARENLISQLREFKLKADADLAALLQVEMKGLLEHYEELKRSCGKLDFVDLLIQTRKLIHDNDSIRWYFQKRFTHILVDEFQDTDPLQAEILLLLSADDPEQRNWLDIRPVPGKLFLVGDPKQSIYRFRRADVFLYKTIKRVLLKRGVNLVHLRQNFRSVRPIQQAINIAFEAEMEGDARSGQPEYVSLEEFRPAPDDQPSIVVLPVPRPYGVDAVANYAIDACLPDTVAAFLDWLLKESRWTVCDPANPDHRLVIAPGHICLLFRRFVSWGTDITRGYTRALEARRIPHVLVGSRSFHEREEVETMRAALSAVEWPDDELSVFATLRGSLFWVPDSLLLRFRHEIGSLHPFRSLPNPLHKDFEPVVEALRKLAELHRRRHHRPLIETVNKLLEATRAHAGFALRPAGHQVLANVQRICDLAHSFEVSGGISFRAFVEYLEDKAKKQTSAEAPVLEEGTEGIRLMTVHAAKGLEFPVVILVDMTCNLSASRPEKYVDTGAKLAAFTLLGCAPWDLIDHHEDEKWRDEAEGVRIAYVAATRARDLLVVSAVGDEMRKGWSDPLNKVIYPPKGKWRNSEAAKHCPKFNSASVMERPVRFGVQEEFSVKPGLHRPQAGEPEVVWWDPSVLNLDVQADFGLRQEQILAKDSSGKEARRGLEQYKRWKTKHQQALLTGSQRRFDLLTVTEEGILQTPPKIAAIQVETVREAGIRPSGLRFGTLVHTILRDVNLDAKLKEIQCLATFHGQILCASKEEIEAAVQSVNSALGHSLLKRAAMSQRCHRELPILLKLNERNILEGTIDLAFFDNSSWTVVDFKTDTHLGSQRSRYQRQLAWYVFGLSEITGSEADGWLLGI